MKIHSIDGEVCGTCEYYLEKKGDQSSLCLRFPPTVQTIPMVSSISGDVQAQFVAVYPRIGRKSPSCGEYKSKIVSATQ